MTKRNDVELVPNDVAKKVAKFLEIEVERVNRKSPSFAAIPSTCNGCSKHLDFHDFVLTAFATKEHSKEFMVKFLDSNLSMGRTLDLALTCAACQKPNDVTVSYYYDESVCGAPN